MIDRKADARRKIQLGGLIMKAGLDEEPAAVLLGLLLEAAETLAGPVAKPPASAGGPDEAASYSARSTRAAQFCSAHKFA